MEKKEIMEKRKSHAFGKDVYLLGVDSDNVKYWLESPSWDCDWYWGFGYVETYTNNRSPGNSKDIASHQHIDTSFMGRQETYNLEKHCFELNGYIHNIYNSPTLKNTTFTEKEGWQLSELFTQFYLLSKMAAFTYRALPGCHITTSPVNHGDLTNWNKKLNNEMLPNIMNAIIEILTPNK